MRNYETACVFRTGKEILDPAKEEVLAVLQDLGAVSLTENDMGVRNLSYPIKNEIQAHFVVFNFEMDPVQVNQIANRMR